MSFKGFKETNSNDQKKIISGGNKMKKRTEFKVGDPVTNVMKNRIGYIEEISEFPCCIYRLMVKYVDKEGYKGVFRADGRDQFDDTIPVLVHGHNARIEVVGEELPEEPEVYWVNLYRRCGTFNLGTNHSSKEAAEANIVGKKDYIKTIKVEI